jgi:hypothetical protein
MSWLRAAEKVAGMHSPQACSRCGVAVSADSGWCAKCGLPRGASPAQRTSQASPATDRAQTPRPRVRGQVCICGAAFPAGAEFCRVCGRSRLALALAPSLSHIRAQVPEPARPFGLSRSFKIAVGSYVAVAVIFATVGLSVGIFAAQSGPDASPTAGRIAAASGSGTASGSALANGSQTGGVTPGGSGIASLTPGAGATEAVAGQTQGGTPGPGSTAGSTPASPAGSATPGSTPEASATPAGASPAGATPTGTAMGPTPSPTQAATATPGNSPTPAPTAAATEPAMFLDIVSLPAQVVANSSVSLVARTLPAASCTAKVKNKSGLSIAEGLKKKQIGDSAGMVSWTWIVDDEPGTATATVSCDLKNKKAEKSKVFVVLSA